jgi:hypothetical protein
MDVHGNTCTPQKNTDTPLAGRSNSAGVRVCPAQLRVYMAANGLDS